MVAKRADDVDAERAESRSNSSSTSSRSRKCQNRGIHKMLTRTKPGRTPFQPRVHFCAVFERKFEICVDDVGRVSRLVKIVDARNSTERVRITIFQ